MDVLQRHNHHSRYSRRDPHFDGLYQHWHCHQQVSRVFHLIIYIVVLYMHEIILILFNGRPVAGRPANSATRPVLQELQCQDNVTEWGGAGGLVSMWDSTIKSP